MLPVFVGNWPWGPYGQHQTRLQQTAGKIKQSITRMSYFSCLLPWLLPNVGLHHYATVSVRAEQDLLLVTSVLLPIHRQRDGPILFLLAPAHHCFI